MSKVDFNLENIKDYNGLKKKLFLIFRAIVDKITALENSSGGGDAPVTSVNGQIGDVVLNKGDVGLANADNTSDLNKPISTATQAALDLKANTADLSTVATSGNHSDLTLNDGSNPHGTTKSDVGLANVDNTSDLNKPVSTAQQAEIDTKENDLGNPASDGQVLSSTVAGVRSWVATGITATKWQRKDLTSSISSTGDITQLSFNGLTVGKTYRYSAVLYVDLVNNNDYNIIVRHDGNTIGGNARFRSSSSTFNGSSYISVIFEATDTSVILDAATMGGSIRGDLNKRNYAILEELPNHTEVTDFT